MVLLKHADVGLPAEVTRVDGFDEQVHLVVGNVIVVWIASFTTGALVNLHLGAGGSSGAEVGSCTELHKGFFGWGGIGPGYRISWGSFWGCSLLGIGLDGCFLWHWWLCVWVRIGLVRVLRQGFFLFWLLLWLLRVVVDLGYFNGRGRRMSSNLGILERIRIAQSFCSFNIHVAILRPMEALNWMCAKCALSTAHAWDTLDEADHSLSTVGVEAAVVAGVDISHHESLLVVDGVGSEGGLGVVTEVGDESLAVCQFNFHCLIINCGPLSRNRLTLLALFVAAECGLGLVVVTEVDFDGSGVGEVEIVFGGDDLDAVGEVVGADGGLLEEVDGVLVFAYFESPVAVDVLSQAMDWLISLDRLLLSKIQASEDEGFGKKFLHFDLIMNYYFN